MASYDTAALFDAGEVYDAAAPASARRRMIQLKLELQDKTDANLKQYSLTHITKMTGNASFPAPIPAAPAFQTIHDAFSAALTASDLANAAALQATTDKDAARAVLEEALMQRAKNIEGKPGLTEVQALSTGFGVKGTAAPVGPMPAPQNLTATGGDLAGTTDCVCDPVAGRHSYIAECASSATGPWTQVYVGKKSSFTAGGLVSGQLYYFRMKAVGAAGAGPWSDIAEKRAT
jgi:hypothetical protein